MAEPKAVPATSTTVVPSAFGWRALHELRPGEHVVGADGAQTEVLDVSKHEGGSTFRVTMSDGASTVCTSDRLWAIQTNNDRVYQRQDGRPRWRTADTAEVMGLLTCGRRRDTYVPVVDPVVYPRIADLPLDPYALGLLVGDGSYTGGTPSFSKPEPELHRALARIPGIDVVVVDQARGSCSLRSDTRRRENPLTAILHGLGVFGERSYEKAIPAMYIHAAIDQRLALLQGLLDTDGWVGKNSRGNTSAYFVSTSPRLKEQVIEVVESLGGVTRVQYKPEPKFQGGIGRPAWSIRVRLPQQLEPFRLTRKLEAWRSGRSDKNLPPTRRIDRVEPLGSGEGVQMKVAAKNGLIVTERFIVIRAQA